MLQMDYQSSWGRGQENTKLLEGESLYFFLKVFQSENMG
jgi:hypothetical protein